MIDLSASYWESRWDKGETGWDIGHASPALIEYFENVIDKTVHILIPGAGNAYEAEALFNMGFKNVHVIDFAHKATSSFLERFPEFPKSNVHHQDFFEFEGTFDYIVEQTFFCALNPTLRERYCEKMRTLLKPNGTLLGVWFNIPLFSDHPPFGGHEKEYKPLFEKYFSIKKMEACKSSIKPRQGNELFIELTL